ncbi:hypothetical protein LTR70_000174 [Exophiala xenobiotica]|uniref:F-box domain-containing protein n=1 Tax=Lithohypha guttulata TaxID=1690604 RepID=A0ABR0KPA9_9EURO|nr:hypothetical protein LTR24_000299 [Lithohypha guttulata]KAK5330852.1 hypothetical protein LTR70_000174 [Exophiala xenobiotica]
MIDQLPQELLEQILGYLPTASSITNVSQVSQKLYASVRKGENVIFHDFVKRQFPTIDAAPPWQKAAFGLTSRSRAWDRRAFVARECTPPRVEGEQTTPNGRGQTFGFMPVIDSYEVTSTSQSMRREVLAWGAGGRIVARTVQGKSTKWSSFSFPQDDRPENDILDLRLLRPHQNRNERGESMFIRRANRELALLQWTPGENDWVIISTYLVPAETAIDCVDISEDDEPLVAVCNSGSIHLFPLHTSKAKNRAKSVLLLAGPATTKQRKRCAKFLSSSRLAIAPQYLEGRQPAPIEVFDIKATESPSTHIHVSQQLEPNVSSGTHVSGRIGANVLATIDDTTAGEDSELLLSGWSDGVVRMYDLRISHNPIREFSDPVDDGQIFSILPIGQERFLAGSHQNGCLKTFDMRLNGRVYDYTATHSSSQRFFSRGPPKTGRKSGRDINIFLAVTTQRGAPASRPLHLQRGARASTYRGSLYSLTSPSPSSPTIYVGIENHVIQIDFINSDDLQSNRGGMRDLMDDRPILNLSCYERPRTGHESTDPVLLKKQTWQKDLVGTDKGHHNEPGWDERWHMEQLRGSKEKSGSWRLPARPSNRRGSASRPS